MTERKEEYRIIGNIKWLLQLTKPLINQKWKPGYISCPKFFESRWGFYKQLNVNNTDFFVFFAIDWSEEERDKIRKAKKRKIREESSLKGVRWESGMQGFFFFLLNDQTIMHTGNHRNSVLIRIEDLASAVVYYIHGDGFKYFKENYKEEFQEPHENIGRRKEFVRHIENYSPDCFPCIQPEVRPDPNGFLNDIMCDDSLIRMHEKHNQLLKYLNKPSLRKEKQINKFLEKFTQTIN